MTRRVQFNGRVHEFPDDATDEEVAAALEEADAEGPPPAQVRAPSTAERWAALSPEQQQQVRGGAQRRQLLRVLPMGILAQPIGNMLGDPTRREELSRSTANVARRVARDLREVPNLDAGRLAQDTLRAGGEAVQNLPETLGTVATHLPDLAAEMTYRPFQREEDAQFQLDLARAGGDEEAAARAARQANEQTGRAGLNVVGFGAGSLVRTPLQAAGFAAALDAPFALSHNADQPLQERLPHALTEMGGAAATGAVLQSAPGVIARGLEMAPSLPRFELPSVIARRFRRANVDPSLAGIEGGGIAGTMQRVIGDNWLAGGAVRARSQRQAAQVADTTARITRGYGRARSPEDAGRVIQQGVERYARDSNVPNPLPDMPPMNVPARNWSFKAKMGAMYDAVLEPILDNAASLTNTMAALAQLSQRSSNRAVRQFATSPILRRFEMLANRLNRGARDSFEAANADDLAAMVADIQHARASLNAGDEQTLTTWLRRRGAVDDRGDLRGMDLGGRGASAPLRGNGRTIDDLAIAAWEDGFFPGHTRPPTAREFVDAVDAARRVEASPGRPEARQVLDWYEQRGVDTGRRGAALEAQLKPLLETDSLVGRDAPIAMRDLRELRRTLREAQETPGLGQSVDNAALQRLEAALTRDISEAAGPQADALRRVDTMYRKGRERIDTVLREFADGDASAALPNIMRLASRRGDTRALATLRGALKDDEWRTVVASLIEHMAQPTPGAAGFTARLQFSLDRLVTGYRSMTPQARRIIFGGRGGTGGRAGARANMLAEELDNLMEVAARLKGVERMANFSGSATHLQNAAMATAAGAAGATGGAALAPVLAGIAAMGLLGEVFTNPAAVRWLARAPKSRASAPQTRRWLADLRDIAARDPALVPVYNELARPQDGESSRPGDGSRHPQRSLEPVRR